MGTQPLNARAGPSAAQCTALDGIGQAVTFNPTAPGNPTPASVDAGHALAAVACPAAGQCTAVDANRRAVTFNPGSPGTTLNSSGGEVTFNPASAIAHNPTLVATARRRWRARRPASARRWT